mmetsp:Transcript_40195/g.100942  ORF Transcript_40195/g.100942 Transcript_40195/m.100942 type:complete len:761 (+) Transcript_40195:88-2370(+)
MPLPSLPSRGARALGQAMAMSMVGGASCFEFATRPQPAAANAGPLSVPPTALRAGVGGRLTATGASLPEALALAPSAICATDLASPVDGARRGAAVAAALTAAVVCSARRRAGGRGGRDAATWRGVIARTAATDAGAGDVLSDSQGPKVLFASAAIGLSTGVGVLIFEKAIQFGERFREDLPLPILAPFIGAAIVCAMFSLAGPEGLKGTDTKSLKSYLAPGGALPPPNWPLRAVANAFAAAVTLGSGNSLGPEAPAAVLGANVAFGVSQVFSLGEGSAEDEEETTLDEGQGAAPGPKERAFIDQALQGSKVVAKMEAKEIDKLEKSFRKVILSKGEVLMRQGDDVNDSDPGLYVTSSGELDVFVAMDDAEGEVGEFGKKVARYSGGGQLIGELAVLFRAPRAATVIASQDCVLWTVDRASFRAAGGRSQGAMKSLSMNSDSVVASGAAAGVAAGFNAPIAGIFFASEVVRPKDENSLDLTTRLLAAALSAAVVTSFTGGGPGFLTDVDFAWKGGNVELVIFAFLGVTVGVISYVFRRLAVSCRSFVAWMKEQGYPENLLPFVGALATVVISLWCSGRVQFDGFGALNEVLGDAKKALDPDVSEWSVGPLASPRNTGASFTAMALLGLLASKMLSTAACQASGLVGGAFAPSLFMGACLGAAVGRATAALLGGVQVISSSATYVVVGAASMLAANCSVPVTSVVLAVELAGGSSYEATLPLILGIALALYISSVLLPALFEGLSREDALRQFEDQAENLI